jgi:hypothetical protein
MYCISQFIWDYLEQMNPFRQRTDENDHQGEGWTVIQWLGCGFVRCDGNALE